MTFTNGLPEETEIHEMVSSESPQMLRYRLSRRQLLHRAAILGLSVPAVGLLAACGGNDQGEGATDTVTTPASTAAAGGATEATGAEATATTDGGAKEGTPTETGAGETPASTGSGASDRGEGTPGGRLVFGLLRDPIGFDPHIAYGASSSSLQGNVYDTLVEYDLEGTLTGSLAEQWEISDDGLEYVLTLRQGVTFHNDAPFTADDVVANFDRILDEANGLARRTELSNIDSYEATDESTVTITMSNPYATLLSVFATPQMGIASREWLDTVADPAREMNGTGPFMLDAFEPEVRYLLVKNPNYWKEGLPYLDEIEQLPIADDNARMNALRSGEINFVEYVPWQNMAEIEDDSNFALYKGFDTYNVVRLNPNRAPLDNKLVRQALNYAIDREAVIAVAFGGEGQAITSGLFPQDSPWYQEELDGYWSYDPDRALELLTEAGVDPSTVTLDFAVATISVHSDTAQVVAQQLEQLGFTVNIIQQDVPTLTERRGTGDYQMMQDGLSLAYPDPDAYSVYYDIGGSAYAAGVNYENQELADLLEQGRSELDPERRKEIYLEFERALLEEAPWIYILHRPQAEASVAALQGYQRIPGVGLGTEAYMEYLWLEE